MIEQWCPFLLFACIVSVHSGVVAKQPDLYLGNIKECVTSGADMLVRVKGS